MINKISLVMALMGLAACASGGHDQSVYEDGHPAYENACNGHGGDPDGGFTACNNEAAQTCGGEKYAVLDAEEADGGPSVRSPAYAGPRVARSMVYRCTTTAH